MGVFEANFLIKNFLIKNFFLKRKRVIQNWTSKLQFNGFLSSEKVVPSCLWWLSHPCPFLVLWTFYLLHSMFLVYLTQEIRSSFFRVWLALWRLFSGELSWTVHDILWWVQWRRMTPFMLSCCCSVQLINTRFNDSPAYLLLHEQFNW